MKNIFKAVIVDDERLARKELSLLLSEYPNIEIVGEAASVSKAQDLIAKLNPDLIFLDIQMPGESGFDLINTISTSAQIIFVTAFDEYAIRAFEINALDYLLKPVNPSRLKEAISRLDSKPKMEETKLSK
jgi:two-component system LytT family response regulator